MAIKVFRLDITPEQSAALVREFEKLVALHIRHGAVASPIAAGMDGYSAYLAVEYVVGDSLDVSMRDAGPMPLAQVVPMVDRMASAIDACADRGVHHGLLHPRDVIVSGDGPRVTGFGIAEALTRIGLRLPARQPYAAPEGASDVYSLAAIVYELISGRPMTPAGWDELSAEDGPELREAFAAALSRDPQARPRRAGEFVAKLKAAGESERSRHTYAGRVIPDPAPPVEPVVRVGEPDPELDPAMRGRFTDAGAAADLHLDFVTPIEPELEAIRETPLPQSWSAQPSALFQAEEPEPARGRRPAIVLVFVIALVLAGVAAYLLKGRQAAPPAAVKTTTATPPVAATTVDLPPGAHTVPPEPSLPPPTPSRPASGAIVAPPSRGRLLIRSTPADAGVVINGQSRGKTPLTIRDLAFGSYTIQLTRAGFTTADRVVRLTAKRPSESIEVSLRPAQPPATAAAAVSGVGGVSVESRPSGARVFVNDRLVGSTPLAIPDLPAGPATVRIELDGYQPWITTARVTPGEQTRVAASLDRK